MSAVALAALAVFGSRPPDISRYLRVTQAAMPTSTAVRSTLVAPEDVPPPSAPVSRPHLEFASAIPPTSTELDLPSTADGHRVYVEGTFIGQPASPFRVRCGRQLLQIGTRGRARALALPCGERLALAYP